MTTVVHRRPVDFSHIGVALLIPVMLYWFIWGICCIGNDNTLDRLDMFYAWVPRHILFLPVHGFILLLSGMSLSSIVFEKLKRGTRWYKTPPRIQWSILASGVLLFINLLQLIY